MMRSAVLVMVAVVGIACSCAVDQPLTKLSEYALCDADAGDTCVIVPTEGCVCTEAVNSRHRTDAVAAMKSVNCAVAMSDCKPVGGPAWCEAGRCRLDAGL